MNTQTTKRDLAYAYRILAYLKLEDHTYTHLSARDDAQSFFIYPFGLSFAEVSPESLMHVTLNGEVLEGQEHQYNETGYCIHGNIYKARSDVRAIFHLHTPSSVAVSVLEEGLLPLSQWALHFYGKVAYHAYDSLILNASQASSLVADLGDKNVMLLRGHGLITCGKTIHEALFYAYHLEKACQTQCLALSMKRPYILPSEEVCQKAVETLLNFEKDLGLRDWKAWVRIIQREQQIAF